MVYIIYSLGITVVCVSLNFMRPIVDLSPVSGPPECFQVTNTTSTSLSFSWTPPLNPGGPISHFVLRTSSQQPVLATGLNITVTDLQPFTLYNTTVQAVNGLGAGAPVTITTHTGEGST